MEDIQYERHIVEEDEDFEILGVLLETHCSICDENKVKFLTRSSTCTHAYCASCILSYQKNRIKDTTLVCPVCLEEIHDLVTRFTAEEMKDAMGIEYIQSLTEWNKRLSKKHRPVLNYLMDIIIYVQVIYNTLTTEPYENINTLHHNLLLLVQCFFIVLLTPCIIPKT